MQSSDILLATLNAKFIHCAFGLRYLLANMGELQPRTALLEFEIQQRPLDIVEAVLARQPRIVGFGIYIWNVRETTEVVGLLKRIAPEVIVILGGPEVSYEWEDQEVVQLADHVITGEADVKFAEVCAQLLANGPDPALSAPKRNPTPPNRAASEQNAISTGKSVMGPPATSSPLRKIESALGETQSQPSPDGILHTQGAILRTYHSVILTQDAITQTQDAILPTRKAIVSDESAVVLHPDPLPHPVVVGRGVITPSPTTRMPPDFGGALRTARPATAGSGAEGSGEQAGDSEGAGAGAKAQPLPKIIPAELPKLEDVALPYDLYTAADLAHRVIYVEASRGCPFTCEFCLSSLDIPVRQFPLEKFLAALEKLLVRGATQFKFVDRTFNLNLMVSRAILQFFLARMRPGLFVHFEMVPDRLPEPLREVIAQFPPGSLQFEVGVQTFDDQTSRNISRRQDHGKLADNLTWLRHHTGVHVHADLIVGLPGESPASFARGFDRLVALGPQEIQVGILKRLRGTPIMRHDNEHAMRYSPQPPYELLSNRELDFATMQRLRRFARYWDLVANSGNFRTTTPLLWSAASPSPFWCFLAFSDWLFARLGKRHAIALDTLAEALFTYLTTEPAVPGVQAAAALWTDYQRNGRRDRPAFLAAHLPAEPARSMQPKTRSAPKRQARHLEAAQNVRPAA